VPKKTTWKADRFTPEARSCAARFPAVANSINNQPADIRHFIFEIFDLSLPAFSSTRLLKG
jgi:hypothetical protein